MSLAPWTRTHTAATGRVADVVLIAFFSGELRADVPLSSARFGFPGAASAGLLDVREHRGADAVAWLDGFRRGALRGIAASDLGDLGALDAADGCVTVRATVADPFDLIYLQAAWAMVRWMCARGAGVVLDARAMQFWPADAVSAVAADAAFDVRRELKMIVETEPVSGLGGHVVHSRGMGKLARPDLVTVVSSADAGRAAEALWRIAARLADGALPSPRAALDVDPAVALFVTPAPPGSFVDALGLENDALLVVAADGAAPVWPAHARS